MDTPLAGKQNPTLSCTWFLLPTGIRWYCHRQSELHQQHASDPDLKPSKSKSKVSFLFSDYSYLTMYRDVLSICYIAFSMQQAMRFCVVVTRSQLRGHSSYSFCYFIYARCDSTFLRRDCCLGTFFTPLVSVYPTLEFICYCSPSKIFSSHLPLHFSFPDVFSCMFWYFGILYIPPLYCSTYLQIL